MSDPLSEALARGDLGTAEPLARAALAARPDDEAAAIRLADILRALRRGAEAIGVLEDALARRPASAALRLRLAEAQLARGAGQAALDLLAPLAADRADDPRLHQALAGAWRTLGDRARAIAAMETALALAPRDAGAWLRREMLSSDAGDAAEALAVVDRGLAVLPGQPQLLERRIALLVQAGRREEAARALDGVLAADPAAAWAHVQLGRLVQEADRGKANAHFRQAAALAPDDIGARLALAYSLGATPEGLEEAVQLILPVLPRLPMSASAVASQLLWRAGFYAEAQGFGGFAEIGRYWAANGAPAALLQQFAKVETDADRLELLAQHRLWAARAEAAAAARPIVRPPRGGGEKLRLGLLSSDLRKHVVARFLRPILEHLDPRFELFGYSGYPGPPDSETRWIASRLTLRRLPADDRDAAAMIAADGLDMLIDLGGTTEFNRPAVLAWKPAPVQASWLGYMHSVGLSAVDYLIGDPRLIPPRRELFLERPLLMPETCYCMDPSAYPDSLPIDPTPPVVRNGYVTFGTANNPYKYSPRLLRAWARVVAATPGSRFLFVRGENASESFRRNMARVFAEAGVGPERLAFPVLQGDHWTHYNGIDIALDSFPQTGGTTTCDALWMGVPTVSLRGEAYYERISSSLLGAVGLEDLVADDADGFVATAMALAADVPRLAELRTTLRDRIRQSPLGQPERFARDFYEMVAGAAAP
jgi:predicted O-linked N-acetylglucosamine transferase (SPINDLY family)